MSLRSIHFIVLGILLEEPKHGYQIHKELNDPQGIGAVWRIKKTNIYGLMDMLEKNGAIQISQVVKDETSYPPKKYFEITDIGVQMFKKWVHEPVHHGREIRQVFLSKLYFVRKESPQAFQQLVSDQITECKSWLRTFNVQESEKVNGKEEFVKIVQSFRKMQINSYVCWLEDLQEAYAKS